MYFFNILKYIQSFTLDLLIFGCSEVISLQVMVRVTVTVTVTVTVVTFTSHRIIKYNFKRTTSIRRSHSAVSNAVPHAPKRHSF